MMKKKEFNHQIKLKKAEKNPKKSFQEPNQLYQKKMAKLKVNLSSSLKYIIRKKNQTKDKTDTNRTNYISINNSLKKSILLKNLKKYDSKPLSNSIMIITNLINCKPTHYLAVFKDYLIADYVEEFFRRIYFLNESIERIPKLFNYYQNYLMFFCKPTFNETFCNIIIKNYADFHAEYFYKNNIEKNKDSHKIRELEDNNNSEEFIKTIFTKSIKNSIDNINEDEYNKKINQKDNDLKLDIKQESTILFDNSNNKVSEGNTLLLMINEMKDFKKKKKIDYKNINNKKKLNINSKLKKNFSIESSYKSLITINKIINNKIIANNYNKNILKTYSNINLVDSIKNLGTKEKPKKIDKTKIKKSLNKNDKIINHKNTNNPYSTKLNLNFNTNSYINKNTMNENKFKSPKNVLYKNKFPLSPLILNMLNEKESIRRKAPLTSRTNKDKIELNYIKIIKRKKNENLKILTTTNKNKKFFDFKKIKSLDYLETNECKHKQNNSCNKEILSYNNKKNISRLKKIKYRNINNDYSINKANFELFTRYATINKTISSSSSNFGFNKTKYTNSMKSLIKVKEAKNKKPVYQRNKYRGILSPSHKNTMDNKFYSYKRLNINNINNKLN